MANKFGVDVYDGCGVIGVCAVLYGIRQWSAPAAVVIFGLMLLVAACGPLRKGKR